MNYKSPVYSVTPIHYTKLQANNYNPNTVPATELKLLEKINLGRWVYATNCLLSLGRQR